MGDAKIGGKWQLQPIHPLVSAAECGPFAQIFVSTWQKDSYPLRKASAPLGHGEKGASFWQAQRAGRRLRETIQNYVTCFWDTILVFS